MILIAKLPKQGLLTDIKKHYIGGVLVASALMPASMAMAANTQVDAQPAAEQLSALKDQKSVAVTIYNTDLALVKDFRHVTLTGGEQQLAWRDVSAQMRPETALLRSINDAASLSVFEQNFNFDLLTPQSLLSKYVGQNVSIIKTNPATGLETKEAANVLAANNGVVLKVDNRIETGMPGRIVFDSVPANLRDRPTLVVGLKNAGSTQQQLELSYLTSGLGWKADYVAELNDKDNQVDLSGWVTLTNTSGASYPNAKLQLVAGDVNQVRENIVRRPRPMAKMDMVMAAAPAPMQEESLMEYHLYSLDRLTSINENQTKQVALLSASGIPASKELLLAGSDYYYSSSYGELGQKMKVGVFVQFDNKEQSKLGMPMPKGTIRVYKRDKNGNAQFVGEDSIDHTPKNDVVRLKLGESFDVTADKKQTDFKQLNYATNTVNRFESAYEITLKNAKKEAAIVTVREPIPGEWKIVDENMPHTKPTSNTAVWKVAVPAEGTAVLTYRVQVKY